MNSIQNANGLCNTDSVGQIAIRYSRGKSKYDNAPIQCIASDFDQFESNVLADLSVRKGLAYICAPLRSGPHYHDPRKHIGNNNWRLVKYAEPRQFLAFDFDGFDSIESYRATRDYLSRYRGFGYTTASHKDNAPRARAILLLSRPVDREQGILLGKTLQEEMLKQLGANAIKFDDSVYRGEQPIYTPVMTSETFHFDGTAVDVKAVLATSRLRLPQHPKTEEKKSDRKESVVLATAPSKTLTDALAGASFVLRDSVSDGEGRESYLLAYAGHLRGEVLDQQEIERTLLDYNKLHVVPPLDEETVLDRARRYEVNPPEKESGDAANDKEWPEPEELAETLPPVPLFDIRLLPKVIGAYAQDVSERMSCPVDFPVIAAMVALATAIGSRIHCKPYEKGTWLVPAGAWGMVVSSPSAIKSPPLSEMLQPLKAMDKMAAEQFAKDMEQHQVAKQIYEKAVKTAVASGTLNVGMSAPLEPKMTRYVVNDSTYEMLVAIAAANPTGFLVWRDELMGWFYSLNKENQKEARGLYLTGWAGTEGYATDRIGRGHVRADSVNLSLLGTIQPNVLRQIVYDAVAGGGGDDGLVARFQFAVYPDPVRTYVKVDREPDLVAMKHYKSTIRALVNLDASAVGASFTSDGVAYLPFDDEAQVIFDNWRQALEDRIRAPDSEEHPAMLAHLGKYRSLFPKIALILHLAAGKTGPIGKRTAACAHYWTEYLEAHSRRIYHTATNRAMQSAVALANKIKASRLKDGFTKSDILVKEWAGLRTAEEVGTALTVLRDGSWLIVVEDRRTGGRPAERYFISPRVQRAA